MQNVSLPENSLKRLLTWSQFRKAQALCRERNKVEVLEGEFGSLKLFFVLKMKINFYMSHV